MKWPAVTAVEPAPDGTIYVVDQVFKFSHRGDVLMTLGRAGVSGSGPDRFDQPTDVSIRTERAFSACTAAGQMAAAATSWWLNWNRVR